MAVYEEAAARAWLQELPQIVGEAIPRQLQEMRLRRLGAAGMAGPGVAIASVNWKFRTPAGSLAKEAGIKLVHPNFLIPGHDTLDQQAATITVPSGIDGLDWSIDARARAGGRYLNTVGVNLSGDTSALLGFDSSLEQQEARLRDWLDAADNNQLGCMNVVAYAG